MQFKNRSFFENLFIKNESKEEVQSFTNLKKKKNRIFYSSEKH